MSLKTMYEEPEVAPTNEEVAASIPSGGGNTYIKLPEGVVPFEPKEFFKKDQTNEKAMCEMLILPFGVDEHSLKLLPPIYGELGYLNKMHWKLDYFSTHTYVNTSEGPRTFVCPQSVGTQVMGICPMCDKRVELLRDIKEKTGAWNPKLIGKEFGNQKSRCGFLAYINGTDKVYYVEERVGFKSKKDKGKDTTSDSKTTFFNILEDAQVLGTVGKRFCAMSSKPAWLRITWKYTKFPREDGGNGFFWEATGIAGVETSLTGIKAADVKWEHLGNQEYNVCHMIEILPKEEIQKIVDNIVPFKPKKDKEEGGDDPCWNDIANLDVPELIAYAKRHKMDVSAFEPSDPKAVVRKAIMDYLGITRPAA